jgi:hypothetical protein
VCGSGRRGRRRSEPPDAVEASTTALSLEPKVIAASLSGLRCLAKQQGERDAIITLRCRKLSGRFEDFLGAARRRRAIK